MTVHTTITYEQPLNERIRAFLRLELLFRQVRHRLHGESHYDSRITLSYVIDILNLCGRTDLKAEVMKELERQSANLSRMIEHPGVDRARLDEVLRQQDVLTEELHGIEGQIGQALRQNEFITSVRQRSSTPGGTSDFDLPLYHYWLERSAARRISDLERWLAEFKTIEKAIGNTLSLIRDSARPRNEIAEAGFFQESLDTSLPYQMIRITLRRGDEYFPEVSAGKHRYTLRFLRPAENERPTQATDDIEFNLACCVL